jgi:hypothetical protein
MPLPVLPQKSSRMSDFARRGGLKNLPLPIIAQGSAGTGVARTALKAAQSAAAVGGAKHPCELRVKPSTIIGRGLAPRQVEAAHP